MSKSKAALIAIESMLTAATATTDLEGAGIGFVEDLFHEKKFGGNLPFSAVEWGGDFELSEGPDDSDEEPLVPFIARIVVFDKSDSSKANRREKVLLAMDYVAMIRNIIEGDLTLGGNASDYFTKIGDSRVSDRLPSNFWGVEIDIQVYVREIAGSR